MPVTVTISNNIRIRGATTPQRAAITKALTVPNPEYQDRKRKKKPVWGLDPDLKLYVLEAGDIIVPRGFQKELFEIIQSEIVEVRNLVTWGNLVDFGQWNPKYELKGDQAAAVNAMLQENCGVLVAPAGSGKTIMGMRLIKERSRPTLWLTHTKDLMYQTVDKAKETLGGVGNVGILGDGKQVWGDGKLIVAMIQTLRENPIIIQALAPIIGTLIPDECHHVPAQDFLDVITKFPAAFMNGLTATPERKDGLECYLYRGIGPIVYEIKRDGLYDAGRLIKPEIRFVYTNFAYEQASDRNDLNSVDAGGEELDYRALLDTLIADEARAELIARNIIDNALIRKDGKLQGQFQIVLTESVRYCYKLRDKIADIFQKEMIAYPPRMAVIHGPIQRYSWRAARNEQDARRNFQGGSSRSAVRYNNRLKRWEYQVEQYSDEEFSNWQISNAERKARMERCRQKQVDILFVTQLAREGLDLPHLSIGHMAMPKRGDAPGARNGAAVEQEIGRIMRPDPADPTKKAIWFDYVDYHVGVFKSQYYSRRSVYKRLQLKLPAKPKTEIDHLSDILDSINW